MRPNNQNVKRSRGRARRPNGFNQPNVNRNTTFESNGPEGKLRGNAQQLFEKYTALAQDANSAGERISAEAFSQFADHYYRVHQTIVAAMEQKRSNQENKSEGKPKPSDDMSSSAEKSPEKSPEKSSENSSEKSSENSPEKSPEEVQVAEVKVAEDVAIASHSNSDGTEAKQEQAASIVPKRAPKRAPKKVASKATEQNSDETVVQEN